MYSGISNFRGRNYYAWYAPDIAVYSGPWKLNGFTPGMILSV
jgi:GLPGLI family protein